MDDAELVSSNVSHGRLVLEIWQARHGLKPRHWSYRTRVPFIDNIEQLRAAFIITIEEKIAMQAPRFGQREESPSETFHRTGTWPPYYAARLCG